MSTLSDTPDLKALAAQRREEAEVAERWANDPEWEPPWEVHKSLTEDAAALEWAAERIESQVKEKAQALNERDLYKSNEILAHDKARATEVRLAAAMEVVHAARPVIDDIYRGGAGDELTAYERRLKDGLAALPDVLKEGEA